MLLSMNSLFVKSRLDVLRKSLTEVSSFSSTFSATSKLLAFALLSFSAAIFLRRAARGNSFGKSAITKEKEDKTTARSIHPKYQAPTHLMKGEIDIHSLLNYLNLESIT